MKKLILCAMALMYAFAALCQTAEPAEPAAAAAPASAASNNEWLPSFSAVEIAAAADVHFVRIADSEAPRIVFDTKGSYTTKFRFEVKNHLLLINERVDPRRPERTSVTVYYNTLESLKIDDAAVTFREPVTGKLFDLTVGSRASVTMTLDVKDLNLELSGRNSSAKLDGAARYMTLYVANGKVDAASLEVMAARVNVTAGGSASIYATERLEATTSTNGTLNYKSEPFILRGATRFMGGDIRQSKQQ